MKKDTLSLISKDFDGKTYYLIVRQTIYYSHFLFFKYVTSRNVSFISKSGGPWSIPELVAKYCLFDDYNEAVKVMDTYETQLEINELMRELEKKDV